MSLSVCLVTRNDEANLPCVLGSVASLGAEVIVIDTGSTDETVAVAQGLGAQVFPFAWDDDFAAARNAALERATGEWILWLNPDEEVHVGGLPTLRTCVATADAFCFDFPVYDLLQEGEPQRVAETVQTRLFRRRVGVRFVGRLHPYFVTPLTVLAAAESRRCALASVLIRRHAYRSRVTEDKLRWAARLLQRELEDRPGQLHYLIEYGRHLLWLNDAKGHAVLAQAYKQLLPQHDGPQPPIANVAALLEYLLTVAPAENRSGCSPREACALVERWFAHAPPLVWRCGEHYFRAGDFGKAAQCLERVLGLLRTGQYDRALPFDGTALSARATLNLGICYLRLGRPDDAERCFLEATQSPLHREEAARGLAAVQQRRRAAPPPG